MGPKSLNPKTRNPIRSEPEWVPERPPLAEAFKCKHVIGSAEEKDGIVAIWLNEGNYPDLCVA